MPADILTMRLPVAMTAPGSAVPRPPTTDDILTDDARLRVGVHYATKVLKPVVTSTVNLRRVARLAATAIAVNAPQDWTVADLVDWLTIAGPDGDTE